MTVLITLTTAGTDSGPFNLYTNLDGYTTAFATGVSKSALLAGYSSTAVTDFTTTIRVKSTGNCVNYIDIVLTGLTTTTTTTTPVTCAEFELAGGLEGRTFNFTNCDGNPQSVTIPAGDSAPFCIRLPYFASGATNIGACGGLTTTTTTTPSIPSTTLSYTVSGTALDACNFYGDPGNEVNYYVDDIWSIATGLYQTTPLISSNFAPAAWYCNGSSSRYWNGTEFVGSPVTCPTI